MGEVIVERSKETLKEKLTKALLSEQGSWVNHLQWGEQVFGTLPILHVFQLTKHVEVCHLYHRYTSTVRDGI